MQNARRPLTLAIAEDQSISAIPKAVLISNALPGIAMVEDLTVTTHKRVVGENIVGTAFAVDNRGYFLTAKHVVQGIQCHNLELRTNFKARPATGYGMFPFAVQAVYPHPTLDIAVLAVAQLVTEGRVNLKIGSDDVSVGEDVLLVGYGTGTDLIFCDDILGPGSPKSFSPVSFVGMICARVPDDIRPVQLLVYDSTTFAGNSGAPVICIRSGSIEGLHLRGYENHIGYAIPIGRCLEFVDAVARVHEPRRSRYNHLQADRHTRI